MKKAEKNTAESLAILYLYRRSLSFGVYLVYFSVSGILPSTYVMVVLIYRRLVVAAEKSRARKRMLRLKDRELSAASGRFYPGAKRRRRCIHRVSTDVDGVFSVAPSSYYAASKVLAASAASPRWF